MTSIKPLEVHAEWDEAARVWIATSDDVPGLCAQADTFEELQTIVAGLVPDLLELNGVSIPAAAIPVHITAELTATVHID